MVGRGRANLRGTQRFVLNCPFISARIRPAALLFLRGSAWKEAKLAESVASGGRALKYSRRETLASATHQHQRQSLHLSATQVLFFGPLGEARSYTRTLLRATRGYDVGNDRELSQVARKMGAGGARDVLQAATLWSLSVGPGTWSRPHELAVFTVGRKLTRGSRGDDNALLPACGRSLRRLDQGRRQGRQWVLHHPGQAAR